MNKSDGFMPIRNVSIATDNDQAPPHVPVFGKHDGVSNNSQMIHSIHEGTISYSSSLTSFPEQLKEPSKFWMLSDNFFKLILAGFSWYSYLFCNLFSQDG